MKELKNKFIERKTNVLYHHLINPENNDIVFKLEISTIEPNTILMNSRNSINDVNKSYLEHLKIYKCDDDIPLKVINYDIFKGYHNELNSILKIHNYYIVDNLKESLNKILDEYNF